MAENTFLGLQPYTENDAYRFKGRTEESQELFRLIVRNDFTVCYAESGEGKTSLLNAGVFPLLRENMYFPISITFTSDDYKVTPDNFSTIIDRCIKDSITEYNEKNKGVRVEYKLCSTDFQGLDCQAELQQELNKYSWWKLRNYKPQAMGLTFTPVFVFDQFEEVFNMPGSIVWTKKFFDWLEDVSSDSCPEDIIQKVRSIIGTNAAFPSIKEEKDFKAVFSLRKEFIGELDYWGMQKCFIPSLKDNRYCLKALTYEGARKVMTQQQRFEGTKVEQVLRYFVQQYSREPGKTITENLPIIPALLLSVVCDSWEKDIDFFSGKDEKEIGQSLNRILERFYDEAFSSIVNKLTQQEANSQAETIRNIIETAIFALVDSNGKRVRRKYSELSHLNFDANFKEILSDKRIIKISKVDGEDYVEIIHDALCPIIAQRKELYLAAEAKKREEERLREQTKKNRKRMMIGTVIGMVIIGILLFFLWQNNRFLEVQEARSQSEAARDSIQSQKEIVQQHLNYSEVQNDSLKKWNNAFVLLYDSISKLNKTLTEKISVIEQQKTDIESQYRLLMEQKAINKQQETQLSKMQTILNAYNACIFMRDAIANKDIDAIRRSAENFKSLNIVSFNSLRCIDDVIPPLNGHVVFNDVFAIRLANGEDVYNHADEISRSVVHRGQTTDGPVLAKTCMVKAGNRCKYTFASKGHQEMAVIAESGGLVTMRIHVTNSKGLDVWYNDTSDVKKGQPQRMASFDLPTDCRNNVELEIFNCGKKDVSFVVLSN